MTQQWFLIAHTPDGVHVHSVDGDPQDGIDDQIELMRAMVGIPEDHINRDGWNHAVAPGIPHKDLLKQIPADAGGIPLCEHCYRPPQSEPELPAERTASVG